MTHRLRTTDTVHPLSSLKKKDYFSFLGMGILSACKSVCYVQAWCLWRPEEDARCPGSGVPVLVSHLGGNKIQVLGKHLSLQLLSFNLCSCSK